MKRLIAGGIALALIGTVSVQFATADANYLGVEAFDVDRIEIDVDAHSTLKLLQHDSLWSLDLYQGRDHVDTIDEFAVSRVGRSFLQLEQLNGPLSLKVNLRSGEAAYGNLLSEVMVTYSDIRAFDDIVDAPTQATIEPPLSQAETLLQRLSNLLPVSL